MLLPVLVGGETGILFEDLAEVAVGGEAEIGGDGGSGLVGPAEEAFGFLRFFIADERGQGNTGFAGEAAGQVLAAGNRFPFHAADPLCACGL